jgi:pimeloyl-ACP methyl ester carboxylesterase
VAERRAKLLRDRGLESGIGLPVRRRSDASSYSVPVRRRRLVPSSPPRPQASGPFKPEPLLSDADYEAALGVLRNSRNALERSPSMTANLNEELYTARAHNNGTVDQFIEEVLGFPHKQRVEDLQHYLDAFVGHDTTDRLPRIATPTLVLAGGRDSTARPPLGRACRADPRRPVRGDGERGPSALPGDPGRVERPG